MELEGLGCRGMGFMVKEAYKISHTLDRKGYKASLG